MMKTTILLCMTMFAANISCALFDFKEGRLSLSLDGGISYDNNISANSGSSADTNFNLNSRLSYSRSSRMINFQASVGVLAKRYLEKTEFNDENVYFDLSIIPTKRLETSRFSISGNIILSTTSEADADVGQIVTTRNYGLVGSIQYRPSRRYFLSLSGSANRTEPDSNTLSASDTIGTNLRLTVPVNARWNTFVNTGYTQTSRKNSQSKNDDVLSVSGGIGGAFTPKLSGNLSTGVQQRRTASGDELSPFLSADIGWKMNETTSFNLTANNSISYTLDDQLTEELQLQLRGTRNLNSRTLASLGVGWNSTTYTNTNSPDRVDEELLMNASLSYSVNKWSRIRLETRFSNRSSNSNLFSYDRLVISLAFSASF